MANEYVIKDGKPQCVVCGYKARNLPDFRQHKRKCNECNYCATCTRCGKAAAVKTVCGYELCEPCAKNGGKCRRIITRVSYYGDLLLLVTNNEREMRESLVGLALPKIEIDKGQTKVYKPCI